MIGLSGFRRGEAVEMGGFAKKVGWVAKCNDYILNVFQLSNHTLSGMVWHI